MGSFTQRKATIDALLADIENESGRLFKAIAPQKGNADKKEDKQAASIKSSPQKSTSDYVVDSQGNKYRVVTINNQTWMAENMRLVTENSSCYDNDKNNCETFGRLYSWNDAKTICPAGWSLPKKAHYEILMDAGLKNLNYQFSILPGGNYSGMFSDLGKKAYFWTSTPRSDGYAWYLQIGWDSSKFVSNLNSHKMSVRCIKNP